MGYEKEQDETVWSKQVDISDPMGSAATKYKFVVSVMRYAGGKAKLDIKRLAYGAYKKGEYLKLGRLAKFELVDLLPVIDEAMEYMN
jgi:hypothetical protein